MVEAAGLRPALGGASSDIASTIASPWPCDRRRHRALERAARRGPRGRAARARGVEGRPAAARAQLVELPEELHPDVLAALRRDGHRAPLLPPGAGAARRLGGPDDRHDRHRLGQVAVLQPADARRALPQARARALYLYPTKALAQDQARALAAFGLDQARAPGDLRRRHAARGARADPPQREPRAHQPRHAARRHPAQPRRLGGAVREPRGRRRRRGARLPRRVRLARRQRAAPAAPDRRRLRHRAALPARVGDDRQPGRAGRAPDRPRGRRADRRGRLARAAAADRDVEPAARPTRRSARAARRSARPPSCSRGSRARARARSAS